MVFLGEALKRQPITITIDTIASNKNILVLSPPPPCIQPPFPKCLSKHASDSNVGLRHPHFFAWFKGQGHNWERTKRRNQYVQVPRMEGFLNLMFGYFGNKVIPYISRIHTAFLGEDSSSLGTWNVWWQMNQTLEPKQRIRWNLRFYQKKHQ